MVVENLFAAKVETINSIHTLPRRFLFDRDSREEQSSFM